MPRGWRWLIAAESHPVGAISGDKRQALKSLGFSPPYRLSRGDKRDKLSDIRLNALISLAKMLVTDKRATSGDKNHHAASVEFCMTRRTNHDAVGAGFFLNADIRISTPLTVIS